MKCRVFKLADGSLSIIRLNERHRRPGETDDQFFQREQAKNHTKDAVEFIDMEEATVPTDRSQRSRWKIRAGRVVVEP